MKLGGFMSSNLKDREILNRLRGSLVSLKKALQQIHFIAIAIKFITKIISDAFEILLPTPLFQYLDMKFNFSYNKYCTFKNFGSKSVLLLLTMDVKYLCDHQNSF
jgi:hypothetical protein